MRIYLDLCCLNRPFDDQTQPRIYLETQALVLLLDRIADGKHTLCGSAALLVENNQNLASAETGLCDRLVTCDDRFLKACRRSAVKLKVTVTNLLTLASEPDF